PTHFGLESAVRTPGQMRRIEAEDSDVDSSAPRSKLGVRIDQASAPTGAVAMGDDVSGTPVGTDLEVVVTPQSPEQYAAAAKLLNDWREQETARTPAMKRQLFSVGYVSEPGSKEPEPVAVVVANGAKALDALEKAAPGQVQFMTARPELGE